MQPNLPPPESSPPNPYDFILNNGADKAKPTRATNTGTGIRQRILVVVGGLILLIVVFSVFSAITSSQGKAEITTLSRLAAEQQELIRVADLGAPNVRSTDNKNLAATVSLTMKTSQQSTVKMLSQLGRKLTPAELAGKQNAKTDEAFTLAQQNNRLDETFSATMTTALTTYQANVKKAYDGSTGAKKNILADDFNAVNLIIKSL